LVARRSSNILVAVIGRSSDQFQRVALLLISATLTHYGNVVRFATQMDTPFLLVAGQLAYRNSRRCNDRCNYPLAGIRNPLCLGRQSDYPFRVKPNEITRHCCHSIDEDLVTKILNQDRQYMDSIMPLKPFRTLAISRF
jgi:hypothetical protein